MRAQRTFVLILALLGTMAGTALADTPLKIAVVDVQEAIKSIPDGKAAKAKLEKEAKAKQTELDKQQDEIKTMKEELERQAQLLQESVKRQKLKDYQAKLLALQEAYVQHQQDLKEKEAKLLKPILEKMEGTITKIAEEDGYTMVLEKGEARVLYVVPALDITDKVIKRYGK